MERGTAWPTVTNADGVYNPAARADRILQRKGGDTRDFRPRPSPNVVLQLNQTARWISIFRSGSINQSVEVTSAAPVLQTQATQLGQVIDARTNGSCRWRRATTCS